MCYNNYYPAMSTRLREELKQTRPFESREQEAYLNLQRTAALLGHEVAETLKPYDITSTQYNVLRILRGARPAGLCRNDVKERLINPVPDATRLLDRLEAAGLVERARDAEDRRFVMARITERGMRIVEELDRPVAELHRRQLEHLGAEGLRTLIELLERARERS